jgi:hypothetical protein
MTTVPAKKQTTLGLHATAHEAYEMWNAAPERIKVPQPSLPATP